MELLLYSARFACPETHIPPQNPPKERGAIRDGKWKLVRYGDSGGDAKLHPWQLYNMDNDRSEQNDLAMMNPDRVRSLAEKWEKWAVRARVKPWPWKVD